VLDCLSGPTAPASRKLTGSYHSPIINGSKLKIEKGTWGATEWTVLSGFSRPSKILTGVGFRPRFGFQPHFIGTGMKEF
jgi:hypothetical protein